MNTPAQFEYPAFHEESMGTVIIVDISGYSRFVQRADFEKGLKVISQLLKTLIEANQLGLTISEIEGDAILFYKPGTPPAANEIQIQFEKMLLAFSRQAKHLSSMVPPSSGLSIKLVATYGRLTEYSLGGFKKLYGQAVIEAHRLLKNRIESDTYLLITEQLIAEQQSDSGQAGDLVARCEIYDLGPICYRFLDYASFTSGDGNNLPKRLEKEMGWQVQWPAAKPRSFRLVSESIYPAKSQRTQRTRVENKPLCSL